MCIRDSAYSEPRMATHYVHAGMIALDGVKMSKSLGNLVFVHKLTEQGHEPGAIRLAVFAEHYRTDRDFSDEILVTAEQRLARWRENLARQVSSADADVVVDKLRAALADDLDTATALCVIDEAPGDCDGTVAPAIDGLLGVQV